VYDAEDRVVSVFGLDIAAGVVQAIRSVVNPDKLGHLGPVSDLARLPTLRRGDGDGNTDCPVSGTTSAGSCGTT
jgi:hypothetical protein